MREFQKNDEVLLPICDMASGGEGIGRAEGYTVFVKDAVIGDTVRAKIIKSKKTYGYGKLLEVTAPSPYRVTPPCPVAASCGGCQLQAMSYERELVFKQDKVKNNLERLGGFTDIPMEDIIPSPSAFRYRNKAQYPIGRAKDGHIAAGFYAGHTHAIIEAEDCLLGAEENKAVLAAVVSFMEECRVEPYNEETGEGTVRHVLIRKAFSSGDLMVCLVINGRRLKEPEKLVSRLCAIPGMTSIMLNINRERTNVILGEETRLLYGTPYIIDTIGDIRYQISPLSFFQVNSLQTKRLYDKVLEYAALTGEEAVFDLYCGIGTISLFLARKAKSVFGVEIVPAAVENARENACLNGITNASFALGKAEEVIPKAYEETGLTADVIVVDPPRKGCDEALLHTMLAMAPKRIVYVSCDSATLARDLKVLCQGGYRLEKACPVDQFPQSVHIETIVLLQKLNS